MALETSKLSETKIWVHDGSTSIAEIDSSSGIRIDSAFQLGASAFTAAQLNRVAVQDAQTLTGDGAITAKNGVVILNKAGVIAATIANPTATTDDFKRLTILSITAQAHTVTCTGGFGNGGGGEDVATFSGAAGDNMSLLAYQGYWYVVGYHQVSLA